MIEHDGADPAESPPAAPKRGPWSPPRMGVNLTPMIDVVFQLLIYFMVGTEFKLGEEIFRMDLPRRSASADPFDLPREPLRISVASAGLGEGRSTCVIRIEGAAEQPRTFEELFEFLARHRSGGLGGMFEPDHPIVIVPTAETRWEHAIEAYNAAARARYTNVNFAEPG